MTEPAPGDVVLTRFEGWTGKAIRFGAALLDRPNIHNHVIVVSHRDLLGVLWGIEARAEGVGYVDLTKRLKSRWAVTNADQPKNPEQRRIIVEGVAAMLGTPYDWPGIIADAFEALRIDKFWRPAEFPESGRLPYTTVCSALADYWYERAQLSNPGGYARTRFTSPSDWDQFIITRDWTF